METFVLPDGRNLTYDVYGDPAGTPVIFNHGLSDSRLIRNPDESLTASLGVRVIAADQPGVGGSTPLKDRRMIDWGPDMKALADSLGLDVFNVAGHSGGSPHALSIARCMPERVNKIVLASPVTPLNEKGMSRLLINKDLKLLTKLHGLSKLIEIGSNLAAKKAMKDMPAFMESTAADDPSDASTFLNDPAQRAMFEASFREGMAQGGVGMYEMTMALWEWGFEPEDITRPVKVFYGDADDLIDPQMPQHLASRLPNSELQAWPGAGHYGFVDRARWIEMFSAVNAF